MAIGTTRFDHAFPVRCRRSSHDLDECAVRQGLIRDGEILAAAQEERSTRKKGDARFPEFSIKYCLREAGISAGDHGIGRPRCSGRANRRSRP